MFVICYGLCLISWAHILIDSYFLTFRREFIEHSLEPLYDCSVEKGVLMLMMTEQMKWLSYEFYNIVFYCLQWVWRIRGLCWWQHSLHLCYSMTIVYFSESLPGKELASINHPAAIKICSMFWFCEFIFVENRLSHQTSSFPAL